MSTLVLNCFSYHCQTYDIDKQVSDSAATASAMFSGIKTKDGTLGYDSTINKDDVDSMRTATKVKNLFKHAQDSGMATGGHRCFHFTL